MTKTKEVDRFGNVSYTVRDGERIIGRIIKASSGYQVERLPFDSYAPVPSIKAGMDWLARYGR
jgi:hypothetical protein